jgi:branched-chain amino acid transport system ATP-binding protein
MTLMLQTQNVTKRFGGLVALEDVTLGVEAGEIFGLIGPNGAGKTTLLNVIVGVHKPAGGAVFLQGEPVTGLSPEAICRRGISRTFQICQPFPKMTARENVLVAAVFGNRRRLANPAALADEMLDRVGFPLPHDVLARNLNTVQLKRLDLARALASQPRLLLMDELGAGLTPGELLDLMALIRRLRDEQGLTIILVEHVMRMIMGICDHIAVLQYGHTIAQGTPAAIAGDGKVIEAYLGEKYML